MSISAIPPRVAAPGAALFLALALLLPSGLTAQEVSDSASEEVQVDHPPELLLEDLRTAPDPRRVANTALVFTNFTGVRQKVLCRGFDRHGNATRLVRIHLPGHGLRYLLASDLSNGERFIGSAQCTSDRNVRGTTVFFGPGLTDLPVEQHRVRNGRTRFPLVATY